MEGLGWEKEGKGKEMEGKWRGRKGRAPKLLLNQGPSEPCYATARVYWSVTKRTSIAMKILTFVPGE